jgi:hypothetical protein
VNLKRSLLRRAANQRLRQQHCQKSAPNSRRESAVRMHILALIRIAHTLWCAFGDDFPSTNYLKCHPNMELRGGGGHRLPIRDANRSG